MDEMEEKLGSILNNPQMMQQIMALAQSLNQSQQATASPTPVSAPAAPPTPIQEPPQRQDAGAASLPNLDFSAIQKLNGMARQGGIDQQQQALLKALSPYLSRDRVLKLEKAMRAAKMAKLASAFLNAGGLQILSGR